MRDLIVFFDSVAEEVAYLVQLIDSSLLNQLRYVLPLLIQLFHGVERILICLLTHEQLLVLIVLVVDAQGSSYS